MKMLLLCLGLTLVCVHTEEASSKGQNLNVEKINGEWFSILLASDKREKVEEHGSMRVFVEYIHVLENSLAFKFHTVKDDSNNSPLWIWEPHQVQLECIFEADGGNLADNLHQCLKHSTGETWNVDEECSEIFLVADKTEKAGEYSVMYDGFNTFTILKTDYDNYIMFHLINEKDGENFQVMELYGREPDLNSDIKEKFVKLCEEHGIIKENIIDLTKTNRCLQARE